MVLIILRVWHLAVIQYDIKLEEFRRPQRKTVVEPARRATIRDRFNIPLAINKVQYRAAILYSQFKQIPAIAWTKDANGNKIKKYRRREYIKALAQLLAKDLQLDPERLEDLIYSKAAFYYHIPFVIKEDLSEAEYYRLKMLEKDWVGIQVQRLPKRTYPRGKVAADILGYMGAINRNEYEAIIHEMNALQEYVQAHDAGEETTLPAGVDSAEMARIRLKELQERAYTVKDYVGKSGIEGKFEEVLRGFQGKKSYYSDARGNFLREFPGSREPIPGNRLLLTISAELQEYAEQLLIQNERIREAFPSHLDPNNTTPQKQPWIKGGAIVAIEPNSGEIIALATYPRFDPNDFILSGNSEESVIKNSNITRWFESENYIGQIWDQKRPLERERFDDETQSLFEDGLIMTWSHYLDFILPKNGSVRMGVDKVKNIKNAILLQKDLEQLLKYSGQDNMYWLLEVLYSGEGHQPHEKKASGLAKREIEARLKNEPQVIKLKERVDRFLAEIPYNYDKVLLLDLCRIAVDADRFSRELIGQIGHQELGTYKEAAAAIATLEPVTKEMAKNLFHEIDFSPWRKENEKGFLKQKRLDEKIALVRYPKPYLDYLDEQENLMFNHFWNENRWALIQSFLTGKPGQTDLKLDPYIEYFTTLRTEVIQGAYSQVPWYSAYLSFQAILEKIPEKSVYAYLQTLRSFRELNRPLFGRYRHVRKKEGKNLEKHIAAAFYPLYGFGYARSHAYRQAATQGSLFKLVTAYAALKQRYLELENSGTKITKTKLNPLEITDTMFKNRNELFLGYHADGQPIPQRYKEGRLIRSQRANIGKVDFVKAMEASSNPYFSLLAGDYLNQPEDLAEAARLFSFGSRTGIELTGEYPGSVPKDIAEKRSGLYSMAIGQHTLVVTPLQSSVMLSAIVNGGKVVTPKIVKMSIGSKKTNKDEVIPLSNYFPYQESLSLVGIDFPLFSAVLHEEQKSLVKPVKTEIKRKLFMPEIVRGLIFDGMECVVSRMIDYGMSGLSKFYKDYPEAISDCIELKDQFIGKTSTAEAVENIDLDLISGTNTFTHVWFGGVSFDPHAKEEGNVYTFRDKQGKPELVVIIYLKFGRFGKEGAPPAAQVIKKWREIKEKHEGLERNGIEPLTSTMPLLRSTN